MEVVVDAVASDEVAVIVPRRICRRRREACWLFAAGGAASAALRGFRPNRRKEVEEECFYRLGGNWEFHGMASVLRVKYEMVMINIMKEHTHACTLARKHTHTRARLHSARRQTCLNLLPPITRGPK